MPRLLDIPMTDSPAARARREAHEACPCRHAESHPSERILARLGGRHTGCLDCGPLHSAVDAAIDRAIDLAVEEAAQKWGHVACCECGINSPEPAQHSFRDPRCVPEVNRES